MRPPSGWGYEQAYRFMAEDPRAGRMIADAIASLDEIRVARVGAVRALRPGPPFTDVEVRLEWRTLVETVPVNPELCGGQFLLPLRFPWDDVDAAECERVYRDSFGPGGRFRKLPPRCRERTVLRGARGSKPFHGWLRDRVRNLVLCEELPGVLDVRPSAYDRTLDRLRDDVRAAIDDDGFRAELVRADAIHARDDLVGTLRSKYARYGLDVMIDAARIAVVGDVMEDEER